MAIVKVPVLCNSQTRLSALPHAALIRNLTPCMPQTGHLYTGDELPLTEWTPPCWQQSSRTQCCHILHQWSLLCIDRCSCWKPQWWCLQSFNKWGRERWWEEAKDKNYECSQNKSNPPYLCTVLYLFIHSFIYLFVCLFIYKRIKRMHFGVLDFIWIFFDNIWSFPNHIL